MTLPLVAACSDSGSSGGGGTPLLHLETFQSASVVIGQPDFSAKDPNQGGSVGPNTLFEAYGNPFVDGTKLYLPDPGNNRILVYNQVPAANNAGADLVLGQPDFLTDTNGNTAQGMFNPATVKVAGNSLFVADSSNNRVLIWNTIPMTNGQAADLVVGQAAFGTSSNACAAAGLYSPTSLTLVNGKLIVSDVNNNRVLIWNAIPTTNGEPADLVLGQNAFDTCVGNDDNQDGIDDGSPTARTFTQPTDVWSDGTRLIVADSSQNNRVLIWNTFPTSNFAPADIVIGQPDMLTGTPGISDSQFDYPEYLDSNGTQLVVTDSDNSRVMIWDAIPTTNGQPADVVLGQSTFTNHAANDDNQDGVKDATASARTLDSVAGVRISGSRLIIADTFNYRYLIYE